MTIHSRRVLQQHRTGRGGAGRWRGGQQKCGQQCHTHSTAGLYYITQQLQAEHCHLPPAAPRTGSSRGRQAAVPAIYCRPLLRHAAAAAGRAVSTPVMACLVLSQHVQHLLQHLHRTEPTTPKHTPRSSIQAVQGQSKHCETRSSQTAAFLSACGRQSQHNPARQQAPRLVRCPELPVVLGTGGP